jgi:hypothetical protein
MSFFHSHECQRIQIKNPFDKILNLSFDLIPLKMNTMALDMNQFYQMDFYNKTHLVGKKLRG